MRRKANGCQLECLKIQCVHPPSGGNSRGRKSGLKPDGPSFVASAVNAGVKRVVRFQTMIVRHFRLFDPLWDVGILCLLFVLEVLLDAKQLSVQPYKQDDHRGENDNQSKND
jgi:hypothetical protein